MSVARKCLFRTRIGFVLLISSLFLITLPTPASSVVMDPNARVGSQVAADHAPGEVLVKFKKGTRASEKQLTHAREDVDVLSEIREIGVERVKTRRGESTEALLQRYRQNPTVEYAEPNIIYHARVFPNDPRFSDLWGLHNTGQSGGMVDADIDAPEAWDGQIGSPSVVVADIDGGMDLNHPDLAANLWINPGEIAGNGFDDDGNGYVDDYRGWDFYNNDNNPSDDAGHGTHTAGTIAAVGNNGVGVTGVAWQAKIMPLKFLNSSGSGYNSDAIDAILYAANMGVKIVNNSWGCNGFSCFSQALEDAIAYANTAGMLFVVAAGNDGTNNDVTPDYPCAYSQPNIVCVAATNRNDQLASFSNYGAATVDLGAPGSAILSTVPTGSCTYCDPSRYLFASGTSMAAPYVSGAAALILSQFPSHTVTQVRDAILGAVDPLPGLAGVTVTGGRLNIERALSSNFTVTAAPASQTVNAGGSTTYTVTVTSIGTFTGSVTLTFSASNAGLTGSFSPGTVTVPSGGAATSTLSVSAQSSMTAGSYPVTIRGVSSSETHLTTVAVAIAPPDVIMTAVTPLATTVAPGDPLNISNTVQNQGGSNAGAFAIEFHLSADAVYGGADDIVLAPTRSVSSLAMGVSSSATTMVTVPSTTPLGSYYVCAMADRTAAIPEGTAEGNNTLCSVSTITATFTNNQTFRPGVQGNGGSLGFPSVSADGRYVAFSSTSSNLVAGDTNGVADIFVSDRQTGGTQRVSVSSTGVQGNGDSRNPALSADGRYVAYPSRAGNLVAGDTNGASDIFVYDRQTGVTERVSVDSGGVQGNSDSFRPYLSADGRYVAFRSFASNLVSGDSNAMWDVFVRDRQTGATERVSVSSAGLQGDNHSGKGVISADGGAVAFHSSAGTLVAGDTNGVNDVFVRDRTLGTTERVSVTSGGVQGNDHSRNAYISGNGRYIAHASSASNLVTGDTNGLPDIVVYDRQTGTSVRVSVDSGGIQANGDSRAPSLSTDGQVVAFHSFASNLVSGDGNGVGDVFAHDRGTGVTARMSVSTAGVEGNGHSYRAAISGNAGSVAFMSEAGNLVPGDTNGAVDVFVRIR